MEQTELDKELEKQVIPLAESEDIDAMTELLVNWQEHTPYWAVLIQSRMLAPSSTSEHCQSLEQAYLKALENETFAEQMRAFEAQFEELEDNEEFDDEDDNCDDYNNEEYEYEDEPEIDDPELKALMDKANDLQYENPKDCINAYLEAIAMMDENPAIKVDYYYLYAHYIIMFKYPDMGKKYDAKTVEYGKKCLEIVDPIFVNAPFTTIGQFHEEVIRCACNAIAWHSLDTTDTLEGLSELLDYANRGCEYAMNGVDPNAYALHFHDTKVSVLLKMGEIEPTYQEQAFKELWKIKRADKDYDDHDKMSQSAEYKAWLEKEGLESPDSFIVDEDTHKTETAEQAYQRLLKAEKFYGYNRDDFFSQPEPANMAEIERFEKEEGYALDSSYKNFILKHGYISFGDGEYGLFSLSEKGKDDWAYTTFAERLQKTWDRSKEKVIEWFEDDGGYERADNMLLFCSGNEDGQIHYFCMVDKQGFYLFDQDTWYEGPYSFDEFASRVVNGVIEYF